MLDEIMAKISMDLKTKVNHLDHFGMLEPQMSIHDSSIRAC
jgi:hypothetical protein